MTNKTPAQTSSVTRTGNRDCRSFYRKAKRMTAEEKRINAENFARNQEAANARLAEQMRKSFAR